MKRKVLGVLLIVSILFQTGYFYADGLMDSIMGMASDVVEGVGKEIAIDQLGDLTGLDLDKLIGETAEKWDSLKSDLGDQITGPIVDMLCRDALQWFGITDENAAEVITSSGNSASKCLAAGEPFDESLDSNAGNEPL